MDFFSKNKFFWDLGIFLRKICDFVFVYFYILIFKVEKVSLCIYFVIVLLIFNGWKDISLGNWNKFIKILFLIFVLKVKREYIYLFYLFVKDCEK